MNCPETSTNRKSLAALIGRAIAPAADLTLGLLGLFESPGGFASRLEHLARRPFARPRLRVAVAALAALSAVLFILPMASVGAGEGVEAEDGLKPMAAPFIVEVEPGVKVELLGVSRHPSSDDGWWAPDGSPLPEPLIDPGHGKLTSAGSLPYVFVYRITSEKPVGSRWRVVPGGGALSEWPARKVDKPVPDIAAIAATVPQDTAAVQVSVGVSAGEWVEMARVGPYDTGIGDKRGGIAFVAPVQSGDSVVATASDGFSGDYQRRIVITDDEGRTHEGAVTGAGAGNVHLTSVTFPNLSLSAIRTVCLEVRTYRWATFSGVSLSRGRATQVLGTVSDFPDAPPAAAMSPGADSAEVTKVVDVSDILAATPDRATDDVGYDLATSIMASVAPDAWSRPPQYFTVRYYTGGRLIVYASDTLWAQVRDHVNSLRANLGKPTKASVDATASK